MSWAVWIGGRTGSGKTTVTSGLCERLRACGVHATVLDGAAFAEFIATGGVLTRVQRDVATRAIIAAARALNDAGTPVVVDGVAALGDGGPLARATIEVFAQVELVCPPDVCRTRERAVRWHTVACPGAPHPMTMPDLGLDYEPPVSPDLILYTDVLHPWAAAEELLRLVDRLERTARERSRSCA